MQLSTTYPGTSTGGNTAATAFAPQPTITTPPPEQRGPVFIGRFKYVARTAEDLSFDKNERLMVIGGMEGDWWMARSLATGNEGYIPRNYVAAAETYEAEE